MRVNGFSPPYRVALLGAGRLLAGGVYAIPAQSTAGSALLVAGNAAGLAATSVRIASPPAADRGLLVVASYDDGLVFHDSTNFAVLGVLGTGGTPSDVAIERSGRIAATDTEGSSLTLATLAPWSTSRVQEVVLGDEVAFDNASGAVFVTDRDIDGNGALTRVAPDGSVARVTTGATAEGLVVDERRGIVYVANANDGTIAAVDAATMRVVRRFPAVTRIFSLALSSDGTRIFGISNQSAGSPFAAPGSAVAITLRGTPHVIARSADLTFPLGTGLDSDTRTLFVTDEALGQVYVLDAHTLHPKHAPLRTCATPWKPTIDSASERLYVPCAGANAVDVFDTRTLRRIAGAPFRTGSYPLAIAVWRANNRE